MTGSCDSKKIGTGLGITDPKNKNLSQNDPNIVVMDSSLKRPYRGRREHLKIAEIKPRNCQCTRYGWTYLCTSVLESNSSP